MTVRENLEVGASLIKDERIIRGSLEKIYTLFPTLKDRKSKFQGRCPAASGRCYPSVELMSQAKLLLIDEPSVGLAPKVKEDLFDRIKNVHGLGSPYCWRSRISASHSIWPREIRPITGEDHCRRLQRGLIVR